MGVGRKAGMVGCRSYELVNYEDLPLFLQHNKGIASFYRPYLTAKQTIQSLFDFHNESLNVWTHLLGSLLFSILMITSLTTWLAEGDTLDKTVFLIFVLSAQILLFLSSFFHLFYCMSKCPSEYSWFARLDYIGIAVLVSGSYYSPVYYIFSCEPLVMLFYNMGITVLGIMAIAVTFHPLFEKPGYASARAAVFVAMSCFCFTCFPHAIVLHGISAIWPVAWRAGIMGGCYLIGVGFYVTQYPECKHPGKFDRGFSSHVIWHLWVVAGTLSQYFVCKYCYQAPPFC